MSEDHERARQGYPEAVWKGPAQAAGAGSPLEDVGSPSHTSFLPQLRAPGGAVRRPRRGGQPAQIAAFHRRRRPGAGTPHAVSREHRPCSGGGGHDMTALTAAAPTSLCASPAPACAHPALAGRARPRICPPAAGGPSGAPSDSRERLPSTIRAPGREKRTAVAAAAPAGSVASSCQSPCS